MTSKNKYKGTFAKYVFRILENRGVWFRVVDNDEVAREPIVVCFRDGAALKIRFNAAHQDEWRDEPHSEWKWFGEAGKAIRAVERLVQTMKHGALPAPDLGANSVEAATDRAFQEAGVNFRKQRVELKAGRLTCINYRLTKGAILEVRPEGIWQWRGHIPQIYSAVQKADKAFRRHLAAEQETARPEGGRRRLSRLNKRRA
jgi:hypothetical protein